MFYAVKIYSAWTLRRNYALMSQAGASRGGFLHGGEGAWQGQAGGYRIWADHLLAGTAVSGGAAGAAGTAEAALLPLCCCSVLASQGVLQRCEWGPCLSA